MEERNVYQDISRRTDGDVYIGVVGPVRTGKSTFIKRFMDSLVLPNIRDEAVYRRTVDELPQSAAGRTIMTTEPKSGCDIISSASKNAIHVKRKKPFQ